MSALSTDSVRSLTEILILARTQQSLAKQEAEMVVDWDVIADRLLAVLKELRVHLPAELENAP